MSDLIKTILAFFLGVFAVFSAFIGVVILLSMLLAVPTYFLWNWIMPDIFGLTEINLWQAIGINLLSGILFKPKGVQNKKTGNKKELIID